MRVVLKAILITTAALGCASGARADDESLPTPREVGSQADIVEAAAHALRAHLQDRAGRVELEPLGTFASGDCIEPGPLLPEVARNQALAPRMLATVHARCAGDEVATFPVWFKVRAYAPAAVATRDVPAGGTLAASDVRIAEVDVASVREALPASEARGRALQARVPLKAGSPIARAAVRPEPDVVAQQPVLIRAVSGRAKVQLMGLALQSGRVGDRVQVINLSSGDTLLARVTDARAVEIIR